MSAESRTPELEPLTLSAEHQARVDASRDRAARSEADGQGPLLAGAIAGARRLAAAAGMSTPGVYGDTCLNCGSRYALPADRATCAHRPICEDCWPNGCEDCIAEVEAELRRREAFVHAITSTAKTLRTASLDLADSDLRALDWRQFGDLLAAVESSIEALRQIGDRAKAAQS